MRRNCVHTALSTLESAQPALSVHPALEALRQPLVAERRLGMAAPGGANAYVEWVFPEAECARWRTLSILQLTDVQFGSMYCNVRKLDAYLRWALAAPSRYLVLGGDLVEGFNFLASPGSPYEQAADPHTCLGGFVARFVPVAHRVLGMVSGNHERRFRAFGDLTRLLAELLQVPWTVGRQHIAVRFGAHQPFKIALHHGRGSAQTRGSVVNALERAALADDSDLFLMGHLHQANTIHIPRSIWDPERREMVLRDSWAAMGSSFLDYWGSYADMAGYRQSKLSMPLAVLDAKGGWSISLKG